MVRKSFSSFVPALLLSTVVGTACTGSSSDSTSEGTAETEAEAETGESSTGGEEVVLEGGVHKGPFVLGSSLDIAAIDASGAPTGETFPTQTTNDLGEFDVTFNHTGVVSISALGFYYNEITGQLSDANLNLRAFAEVVPGAQPVYVNLITHLTYARVEELLGSGSSFSDARAQAESELRVALGVGPSNFDPAANGVDMNLLGGDSGANSYVLAVSAVVTQAAVTRAGESGSVDANLQEILNAISLDLAEDGMLLSPMVDELQQAEMDVDPQAVEDDLAARLLAIGSSATIPDIDRVLDSDNDDVANLDDNCPRVPNPTQAPVAGLCNWSAEVIEDPALNLIVRNGAIGDFDGDGNVDVQFLGFEESMMDGLQPRFLGDGNGGGSFATVQMPMDFDPSGGGDFRDALGADMDGDGTVDLALQTFAWGVFAGQGTSFTQVPVPLEPADAFASAAMISDFNGDMRLDVAGTISSQLGIGVALGNAGGTRDPVVATSFTAAGNITILTQGDLNGDGNQDLVVGEADAGGSFGTVTVLLGDGLGALSVGASAGSPTGYPVDMEIGDFDGDGNMDVSAMLSTASSMDHELSVWHGDGTGALAAPVTTIVASASSVDHTALRDADGVASLAVSVCDQMTARQAFFRSDGNALIAGPVLDLPGCQPRAGDFNGDGQEDLVVLPTEGNAGAVSSLSMVLVNP